MNINWDSIGAYCYYLCNIVAILSILSKCPRDVLTRCEAELPFDAAEIQATGARLAARGRAEAGEAFFRTAAEADRAQVLRLGGG